ncbi:MAG TPA: peptidoglycan DD-metalloendopeptidase family protein [Clostridia bacterium]|nr:peptidoglycan DD-metalloendopeptidase family protein [Clostridia bacterium]
MRIRSSAIGGGLRASLLRKLVPVAFIAGAVAVLCLLSLPRQFVPTCYQIIVDGEPVAFVENTCVAEEALDAVMVLKSRQYGTQLEVANEVRVSPARSEGAKIVHNKTELARILADKIAFVATGYVINVSGRDVVTLASREEAEGVLQGLKDMFVSAAAKEPGVTVKEVSLSENVSIAEKKVKPTSITDVETAKRVLLRGTDRIRTYKVSRGDSLWSIASRSRMSVEDLRRANPEVKGDVLQVGQTLNLVVPEPFLTVHTVEEKVVEQSIPHPVRYVTDDSLWPWQTVTQKKGKDGIRRIVYQITRANGIETARETISSEIIEEPVEAVVARGSRVVSGKGTGKFVWPARGIITSYYGSRRRDFHQGIDIAAPTGTSVVAADSGIVVFSGYYGGYGKVIFIDHGDDVLTIYGHNSANLVSAGEEVKKGQVIARVGRTGNATGPHLHFEVRIDGRPVDPLKLYQ